MAREETAVVKVKIESSVERSIMYKLRVKKETEIGKRRES
jgi:hypothetical protein